MYCEGSQVRPPSRLYVCAACPSMVRKTQKIDPSLITENECSSAMVPPPLGVRIPMSPSGSVSHVIFFASVSVMMFALCNSTPSLEVKKPSPKPPTLCSGT